MIIFVSEGAASYVGNFAHYKEVMIKVMIRMIRMVMIIMIKVAMILIIMRFGVWVPYVSNFT